MKNVKRFCISVVLIVIFSAGYVYVDSRYYPPVFMYHRIGEPEDETDSFSVSPEAFDRQMSFLKRRGYRVVSTDELCAMVAEGRRLPRNLVAITFDDGFQDNVEAVKILKKYNLPATIYIVVNWMDEPDYLAGDDLDWIVRNSPVTFGSHTLNHVYLPKASVEKARNEVIGSKRAAQEKYGLAFTTFSYPAGGYTDEAIDAVKEAGYLCAFTTNRGFQRAPHLYTLRRIKIADWDSGVRLWVKLSGFYTIFKRVR